MPTIFSLIQGIIIFINNYLIPLVFALAFILFLWGIFQGFIAGGADEKKRTEGRKFALWGIVGLAVMFSVWGLVNLLVNTFGFNSQSRPNLPTFGPAQQRQSDTQVLQPAPEPIGTVNVEATPRPQTNVPGLQTIPQPTNLTQ